MECGEKAGDHPMDYWITRLIHRYSSASFKNFQDLGIHPGQLPVLKMVYEKEGISLGEMAERLHIKPPTVTVTVKRLEKAGLVCKQADEEDLRVSRIFLTEKGKSINKELSILLEKNEKKLTEGFSREEIETLCGYFQRMIENLGGGAGNGKKKPTAGEEEPEAEIRTAENKEPETEIRIVGEGEPETEIQTAGEEEPEAKRPTAKEDGPETRFQSDKNRRPV